MFDLISIGDCVIDTFIPLLDAKVENRGEERELILRFGDKVPVGPGETMVAGNAANNAVGGSRLGLKSSIYTNVGDDLDADKVIHKLKEEEIDTRYVVRNSKMASNHNFVLNYEGERTILVHHQPWKFHLPDLEASRWIYLTSLSPSFVQSNLYDQLVHYLERTGAKLHFNPGTFQIKHGVKKFPRILSLTDVFIVNNEEAKLILGYEEKKNVQVKKLLKELLDLGPRNVVITDGVRGSYGSNGEKVLKMSVFPQELVQVTGAGDAYASGVLAGFFYGEDLAGAMRWGGANSTSVVEHIGPQTGLLTLHKMKEVLKKYSKIVAEEI